jgi:hypothetical protein
MSVLDALKEVRFLVWRITRTPTPNEIYTLTNYD